jgi:hypothetical protein
VPTFHCILLSLHWILLSLAQKPLGAAHGDKRLFITKHNGSLFSKCFPPCLQFRTMKAKGCGDETLFHLGEVSARLSQIPHAGAFSGTHAVSCSARLDATAPTLHPEQMYAGFVRPRVVSVDLSIVSKEMIKAFFSKDCRSCRTGPYLTCPCRQWRVPPFGGFHPRSRYSEAKEAARLRKATQRPESRDCPALAKVPCRGRSSGKPVKVHKRWCPRRPGCSACLLRPIAGNPFFMPSAPNPPKAKGWKGVVGRSLRHIAH